MTSTTISFKAKLHGEEKSLSVTVPVSNGAVVTNHYCPQELLYAGSSYIRVITGESIEAFTEDCKTQLQAMADVDMSHSRLDVHVAGLMATVMCHIGKCNRIIFGDLLIYMDVFSLLLRADGFNEEEIKAMYPKITRTIVDLYPDKVFNSADNSKFIGGVYDKILDELSKQAFTFG